MMLGSGAESELRTDNFCRDDQATHRRVDATHNTSVFEDESLYAPSFNVAPSEFPTCCSSLTQYR